MNAPSGGSGKRRRGGRSGQSIIGFTEAELGLFLALLFFGLSQLGQDRIPENQHTRPPAGLHRHVGASKPAAGPASRARQATGLAGACRSRCVSARQRTRRTTGAPATGARFPHGAQALGPVPGTAGRGAAASVAPSPTSAARSPRQGERLTAVERDIATTLLARSGTAAALSAVRDSTDATRRALDALAPSVSQLVSAWQPEPVVTGDPARTPEPPGTPGSPGTPGTPGRLARDTMALMRTLAGQPSPAGAAPPTVTSRGMAGATGTPAASGSPGSPGSPGSGRGSPGSPGAPGGGTPGGATALRVLGTGVGGAGGSGGTGGPGRSRQTPTCIELKVDTGAVAEVLITGADRYEVRGVAGPIDAVLQEMRPELARARRSQCRNSIRIRTATNLAVEDYILALNALLPYFNAELARPATIR